MKKILIVVGTRPNFIKVTRFKEVAKKYADLEVKILHTGQHYDEKMSTVFFKQFNLTPDVFLNIELGSPNSQMAHIMLGLEKTINEYKPDLLIVPGDVNTTFAAALTANKMNIKIAHLESGLRSFDRTMPEEFNRVLTDIVSDYFFVTEQSGMHNLLNEGKDNKSVFFVGNTMIDTMVAFKQEIENSAILEQLKLDKEKYVLMTMHRPATVDTEKGLSKLIELIEYISNKYKVVFPIHPRTIKNMQVFNLYSLINNNPDILLTEPLDYFSFQKLIKYCKLIITDSGGIQEESTFLQKPCLTLRPNTEIHYCLLIWQLFPNTLIPLKMEHIRKERFLNYGMEKQQIALLKSFLSCSEKNALPHF
jgi:UDP-N-acetylglucosamine 2-epimerase (non-hydrolysing)